ncbi:MAG: DMT family transporter [Fimbriimonadaceae bacterium]
MRAAQVAIALTALALTSFAANSLLCRLALAGREIDPLSFTVVRLVCGAALLAVVAASTKRPQFQKQGSWISGLMLFAYAMAFSLAYLGLTAATGALILFGTVQATMIAGALLNRQKVGTIQWIGIILATTGLVYLTLPGLNAPPLTSAIWMFVAGVSWGIYSLHGRGSKDPIADTAANFLRSLPFAIPLLVLILLNRHFTPLGLGLAVLSGAITSGLGYVAWYSALPYLGSARAATVQLLVPILAAAGGIALLGETMSLRLALAGGLTLGGVALATAFTTKKHVPELS